MSNRTTTLFISFLLASAMSACSSLQSSESSNQNSRVSIVVIHHTTANFGDSLSILTKPSSYPVSSHYLIPEPGDETYGKKSLQTYQLVDESRRAWHAGTSHWAGKNGLNDQSIGIELVNQTWCHASKDGVNPYSGSPERLCFYPDFADGQIDLLVDLLGEILARHPDVKPTHIIGHSDIAPDRKIDPGPRFPWQRLASLGYGAWYDDETVIKYWEQFLREPLPLINIQKALAAYGYNIEPSGEDDQQTRNVTRAFQLHFRPSEVSEEMNVDSTAILFALIDKYYPGKIDQLLIVEAPEDTDMPADNETPGTNEAPQELESGMTS